MTVCAAPCVVPYISHGYVSDWSSGSSVGHNQTIKVTTEHSTVQHVVFWDSVSKVNYRIFTLLPNLLKLK